MPEILTESFCERCGTRYTFESVAPRKTRRIGQFKTLSRGVKNWVMSDDSSLDEALAAARSDEEREVTAQQLDAFHSTFNFCMNCRQYTCANCWNPAEGRCLSCAPNLGQEILPAAFPDATQFEPVRMTDAWPEADLAGAAAAADGLGLAGLPTNGRNGQDDLAAGNGHIDVADGPGDADALAGGEFGDDLPDVDALARLAFLAGDPAPEAVAEPEAAEIQAAEEAAEPADAAEIAESQAPPVMSAEPAVAADVAESQSPREMSAEPIDVDDRAAELAARTSQLLGRFRPGQNIDAELAAYEAELEAQDAAHEAPVGEERMSPAAASVESDEAGTAEPDALTVAGEPEAEEPQAAEPQAAEPEAAEPAAAIAEPADDAALPAAAAAQAAPEPTADVAASPTSDEPAGGSPAPREDRIEQPTWRIFAPEPTAAPADQPVPPSTPGQVPVQASAEPEWPARPEFGESPSMALLAERARASSDAMWAASTREVLAGPPRSGPAAAAAPAGVQPCSNCGLSLSATARFCRRCGTRQG